MRGFNILVVLGIVVLACSIEVDPIRQLIQERERLATVGPDGKKTTPVLTAHGPGITDGQETQIQSYVDQALNRWGEDAYQNALFIQQKVEDSFSGRWVVEVFGGDPSWGRATHIRNDQWVLFFGYGAYSWDYIIWAPEC